MRVENKICFYLNHTRDVTMYSDFFSNLQNKNVCFVFNDLFKEKIKIIMQMNSKELNFF